MLQHSFAYTLPACSSRWKVSSILGVFTNYLYVVTFHSLPRFGTGIPWLWSWCNSNLASLGCVSEWLSYINAEMGVRSRVDGWGAMPQALKSQVRVPKMSLNFFNVPNLFGPTLALGFAQPLTEMSTRKSSGSKARPVRKGGKLNNHLWADCLDNVESSTSHNPIGLHGLLQG
jgi:hypothetical protein